MRTKEELWNILRAIPDYDVLKSQMSDNIQIDFHTVIKARSYQLFQFLDGKTDFTNDEMIAVVMIFMLGEAYNVNTNVFRFTPHAIMEAMEEYFTP